MFVDDDEDEVQSLETFQKRSSLSKSWMSEPSHCALENLVKFGHQALGPAGHEQIAEVRPSVTIYCTMEGRMPLPRCAPSSQEVYINNIVNINKAIMDPIRARISSPRNTVGSGLSSTFVARYQSDDISVR